MEITDDLVNAYYATSFHIFTPNRPITIAASGESHELKELHATRNVKSSAFITAYSPLSEKTDGKLNQSNQNRLIDEVSKSWQYLHGEGADSKNEWSPEPSLLILGISFEDALALGRKYKQHAIVFIDKNGRSDLYACNPDEQHKMLHPLERMVKKLGCTTDNIEPKKTGRSTVRFTPRKKPDVNANTPVVEDSKAVHLMRHIMRNNWLCPQHDKWMKMWLLIPEIDGGKPMAPLPLAAWGIWPNREKHALIIRHIECADERGVLKEVERYLRTLNDEDWVGGFLGLLTDN